MENMEQDNNFEAFMDEILQLEDLSNVIGGIETEYSISLSDIEAGKIEQ